MSNNELKFLNEYIKKNKSILNIEYIEGQNWFASKNLTPFSLAETYMISADIIIMESKNYDVDDIIAWPAIFLYRHAMELYLKQIIEQINYTAKGHDIVKLFNNMSSKLEKIDTDNELLPDENTFKSIMEFHSVSPRSTELRYPDNELINSESLQIFINFKHAQYHANKAQDYFKNLENELIKLGYSKKYGTAFSL